MTSVLPEGYYNAVTSLIFISISVFLGIILILKYFKSKDITLIYVGIAWIIIVESWMPASINLIWKMSNLQGLSFEVRALIGNLFVPLGLILWTLVATKIAFQEHRNTLLSIFLMLGIVFEIILFYSIFFDIALIVDVVSSVDLNMNYTLLWMGLQIIFSAITLITGLAFSWKSLKYEDPEISIRGKILCVAFMYFLIGAFLDILDLFFVGCFFLILSSITFYFGFVLPDWFKKKEPISLINKT
ncbi:MAG: hypothetical protein ACFFAS_01545 [Promethearchaeota archaeon]